MQGPPSDTYAWVTFDQPSRESYYERKVVRFNSYWATRMGFVFYGNGTITIETNHGHRFEMSQYLNQTFEIVFPSESMITWEIICEATGKSQLQIRNYEKPPWPISDEPGN